VSGAWAERKHCQWQKSSRAERSGGRAWQKTPERSGDSPAISVSADGGGLAVAESGARLRLDCQCQSANAVILREATVLAWRTLLKSGCCRAVIGWCSAIQPIRIVHLSRSTTRPVRCMWG